MMAWRHTFCAAAGVAVYGRRRHLLRDYPPEDLSALLPTNPNSEPELHSTSRRTPDRFDRAEELRYDTVAGVLYNAAVMPMNVAWDLVVH